MNGPVIQLEKYQIEELNYVLLEEEMSNEPKLKFNVSGGISDDIETGKLTLEASISQKRKDENRKIDVVLVGYFKFSSEVTEIEQAQQYMSINGTAILLPYLRSITSMVTVLDSEEAIVFPTMNLIELMSKSNDDE